jgi:hypothetical protein
MLTDEKGEAGILISKNDDTSLKSKLNREPVARFVLSILNDEKYFRSFVGISCKK